MNNEPTPMELGERIQNTKQDYTKLPPNYENVILRLEKNPKLVNLVRDVLSKLFKDAQQKSQEFTHFVEVVPIPNGLDKALMEICAISSEQLKHDAQLVGFSNKNRMHMDDYYLILSLIFYYGVKHNDLLLRQLSIFFMLIKLYRGRIKTWWPKGYDSVTIEHVMASARGNSIIKTYPNTFNSMSDYHVPNLDNYYKGIVAQQPSHPKRGIYSILIAAWTRINQQYTILGKQYYKAFENGIKTEKNNDLKERNTHTVTSALSEKIYKTNLVSRGLTPLDQDFIHTNFRLKRKIFDDFNEYILDTHNEGEIKSLYESIIIALGFETNELANMNIILTADKLTTGNRGNEVKQQLENILKYLYRDMMIRSNPQLIRKLRKAYLIMFLIKIKSVFVPKQNRYITN